MKKMMKIFVLFGLAAMTFCSIPAWAEDESPVSASADISIMSRYVWRGYVLSDSSLVAQPSVTVGYKGFGINLWGNLDDGYNDGDVTTKDDSNFNETDLTLSYDWTFDKFSFGVGYIYYGLEGAEDTQELYYTVSYDTILSPTLTIYYDIDTVPGAYMLFGVSHSIPWSDEVSLDLSASVSYYSSTSMYEYGGPDGSIALDGETIGYPKRTYSAFHDANITASMTFPVDSHISITPSLSYTFGISDKARTHIAAKNKEAFSSVYEHCQVYGGVTVSLGF